MLARVITFVLAVAALGMTALAADDCAVKSCQLIPTYFDTCNVQCDQTSAIIKSFPSSNITDCQTARDALQAAIRVLRQDIQDCLPASGGSDIGAVCTHIGVFAATFSLYLEAELTVAGRLRQCSSLTAFQVEYEYLVQLLLQLAPNCSAVELLVKYKAQLSIIVKTACGTQ